MYFEAYQTSLSQGVPLVSRGIILGGASADASADLFEEASADIFDHSFVFLAVWLYMTMYDFIWLCMTMYDQIIVLEYESECFRIHINCSTLWDILDDNCDATTKTSNIKKIFIK